MCTVITVVMTLAFLHSATVQTGLVRLATDELSYALGTHARIGGVHYQFPAKLEINDLYLEDQQGDTLLSVGLLYAHFSPRALMDSSILFHRVDIENVRSHVYKQGEKWNYQFLIDAFAEQKQQKDSSETMLRFKLPDVFIYDIGGSFEHTDYALHELSVKVPYASTMLDSIRADINLTGARYADIHVDELRATGVYNDTVLEGKLHVRGGYRKDYMTVDAEVCGNLDSLITPQISITLNNTPVLDASVMAKGLRNPKQAYIRAECRDLMVRPTSVQDIVSSVQQRPFRLSKEVLRLGDVHYRGLLEGRLEKMKLQGAFRTRMGTIRTDATCRSNEQLSVADFHGKIGTDRFNLGRMLADAEMGYLAAEVTTDVHFEIGHRPTGIVSGCVHSFSYRDHCYSNLCVEADFEEESVESNLSISDEHGDLQAQGRLDWSEEEPELVATVFLHHFRPGQLKLSQKYDDLEADMAMYVSLHGADLNHLNGYILADSICLKREQMGDSLMIHKVKFEAESEDMYHRIMLTSDLGTGRMEGLFDYTTLETTALKMGVRDLPSLFRNAVSEQKLARKSNNRLDMYLYGREIQHLQYILDLPIRVGDYPVLKFYMDESQQQWGLQGYVSEITTASQGLRDITISAHNRDHGTHLDASAEFSRGIYTWHNISYGDTIASTLLAIGDSSLLQGELSVVTTVSQYNRMPLITAEIGQGSLAFNDTVYYVEPSLLTICMSDTSITFDHFRAGTSNQYIEAQGVMSHRAQDKLEIGMGNLDAGYIVSYLLPEKTLTVGGRLTGTAELYGILDKPRFNADVNLRDMALNNCRFGDAEVQVALSEDREKINILGHVTDRNAVNTRSDVAHITGAVDLVGDDGAWGIDIQADSVPLGFIEHWTSGFLRGIEGRAFGHVTVGGDAINTIVTAEVLPKYASLMIPATGCRYYLSDSCFLDSTSIRFPHLALHDEEGNPVQLNGEIHHRNFMDFNFAIDIHTDKGMVINLPENSGETLQGKVYANGDVHIKGDDYLVRLDADAATAKNSKFRLSIDGASSAGGSDFVTFVDHNVVEQINTKPDYSIRIRKKEVHYSGPGGRFQLGLNIEANHNATVQLVLNEKTGDMIEALGDGALQFTYDDKLDKYGLVGTYTISSGKMGFTLANTFRRNFTITDGSTIIFSGDPENPDLDVEAKYRVTASLKDLFGTEAESISKARTSIPVDVAIHITGKLNDPVIRFDIDLPSADEAIRTQVASIINTEEMLMREVVYLVAFGRFYTPEYMSTNTTKGVNEGFSLLSSTITGQINSWLGKLTDRFSMGVNIRNENGFGDESEQEYEAQFQIQPISRILINGNVGYRYSQVSTQPFYGDLDVEFLLTENGKFRLKGFTHMVDKYSLKQSNASTVQGIGFVFKHEFNGKKKDNEMQTVEMQSGKNRQNKTNSQPKRLERSYIK